MRIREVADVRLGWGESLVWDETARRLYFVDCAAQTLHWLDRGEPPLHTWKMPSLPTGVVPTADGRLVVVLDDGLHIADPETQTVSLLVGYPDALGGGRCNDACADLEGNIITGKLNLGPAEGSAWRYSDTTGWRLIDPDISNTNGPTVGVIEGEMTLIIGDTSAHYFSYPYDAATGDAGQRSIFGDVTELDGHPDGAALDTDEGLWCALVGGAQLARFTARGLDQTLVVPVANPTDVAFGGPDFDRLYVTSIEGPLLVVDDVRSTGRPEPRASLPLRD
jgi:sugar lactone lactonase YvrE